MPSKTNRPTFKAYVTFAKTSPPVTYGGYPNIGMASLLEKVRKSWPNQFAGIHAWLSTAKPHETESIPLGGGLYLDLERKA